MGAPNLSPAPTLNIGIIRLVDVCFAANRDYCGRRQGFQVETPLEEKRLFRSQSWNGKEEGREAGSGGSTPVGRRGGRCWARLDPGDRW